MGWDTEGTADSEYLAARAREQDHLHSELLPLVQLSESWNAKGNHRAIDCEE